MASSEERASSEQGPAPSASTADVRWTFAWPDGLRAHVTGRRSLARNGRHVFDATSSWDLQGHRSAAGYVIEGSNLAIEPIDFRPEEEAVNAALVVQMLLPSMTTGPRGDFRSMDHASVRREIESALEAAVAAPVRAHPAWDIFEMLLQPQAIEASAHNNWMSFVEGFANQEMMFGETVEAASPVTMPIGGELVHLGSRYRAVGRTACVEGGPPDACVRVDFESDVPVEELREIFERAAAQLPQYSPILHELRFTGTLVTEPNTLVPHTMTVTKFTRVGMAGERRTFTEEEVREWSFRYDGSE